MPVPEPLAYALRKTAEFAADPSKLDMGTMQLLRHFTGRHDLSQGDLARMRQGSLFKIVAMVMGAKSFALARAASQGLSPAEAVVDAEDVRAAAAAMGVYIREASNDDELEEGEVVE